METNSYNKTAGLLIKLSALIQILYGMAQAGILLLQQPLKVLINGNNEIFQQNLYPIVDIVQILVVVLVQVLLCALLWSQEKNPFSKAPEIAAILVGGAFLVGIPVSLNTISTVGYSVQGVQAVANYSVLASIMAMAQPLSRLGLVLLVVGATASLFDKKARQPVVR